MLIAQGKAAEAAALGKPPPHPISLLSNLVWRATAHQTRLEQTEGIILCPLTQGGARSSLALGYHHRLFVSNVSVNKGTLFVDVLSPKRLSPQAWLSKVPATFWIESIEGRCRAFRSAVWQNPWLQSRSKNTHWTLLTVTAPV
jgi:hypothetical protein